MSDRSGKEKYEQKMNRPRHTFFLNPFIDAAFTRCPKCEEKTNLRKHCLVIHIEPKYLYSINKTCRYCTHCDLIILKQDDIENLLVTMCLEYTPDTIEKNYLIFGTMDRPDWKKAQAGSISPQEGLKRTYPFKKVMGFSHDSCNCHSCECPESDK